jgi:hypothetical protein
MPLKKVPPKIGQTYELLEDFENSPFVALKRGEKVICVKMESDSTWYWITRHMDGAEDWDNCLLVYVSDILDGCEPMLMECEP